MKPRSTSFIDCSASSTSTGTIRALVSLNRRFHRAICEAAHNRYLIATLDGMHDALALLHGNTFRLPNRRSETDAEHRRIVRQSSAATPTRPRRPRATMSARRSARGLQC